MDSNSDNSNVVFIGGDTSCCLHAQSKAMLKLLATYCNICGPHATVVIALEDAAVSSRLARAHNAAASKNQGTDER